MGHYTTGLANYVAEHDGNKVEVISGHPYYPAWKLFKGYPRFFWKKTKLDSGVNVTSCPHYIPNNPTGMRRIIHHISFSISMLPILIWKAAFFRPDVILLVAPGIMPAPFVLTVSKLCGAKTWLHVQDFEVEAAFATGLLRRDSFVGRIALSFDRWVYRKFSRVSSISEQMMSNLLDKGVEENRVKEFRNWADLRSVRRCEEGRSEYRELFNIKTRHVALYSGNIANKQGLDIIPVVADLLKDRDDITFVICGEGSYLEDLKKISKDLPNIRFFPLQPINRLGELLSLATIHLLPQIAGVENMLLPSKLTNMLASGRPVVATAAEGTALAKAIFDCGISVRPGNAFEFSEAIKKLVDDDDLRIALGKNSAVQAKNNWDSSSILQKMLYNLRDLSSVNSNNENSLTEKREY